MLIRVKRAMWWFVGLIALVLCTVPVGAQTTGTPASKLAWDQPNVTSAADAQAFTYRAYADGATTGTVLTGVTCTGTTTVTCSVAFPAFTPGSHTVRLTAANSAGEGPQSAPIAFTFVVVPSAPANVRVQ